MIRLAILLSATLVALYGALSYFGRDDLRAARPRATTEPVDQSAAQDAGPADPALSGAVRETTPTADEAATQTEPLPATRQTEPTLPRFPGPALTPSPEYAGQPAEQPAGNEESRQAGTSMVVTGTRVNMRAGPSTADTVIGALDGGTLVEALGPATGSWVSIRDPRGREGYISGQFLAAAP